MALHMGQWVMACPMRGMNRWRVATGFAPTCLSCYVGYFFTLLGARGGDHAVLRRAGQAADCQRRGAGVAPEVRHNPVFGSPSE